MQSILGENLSFPSTSSEGCHYRHEEVAVRFIFRKLADKMLYLLHVCVLHIRLIALSLMIVA